MKLKIVVEPIHVTDAAYVTPVTQDKRSARSANSERSVNRSTTTSPSLDAMKKRVRVRARPRSWIEPSANPPIITSFQNIHYEVHSSKKLTASVTNRWQIISQHHIVLDVAALIFSAHMSEETQT